MRLGGSNSSLCKTLYQVWDRLFCSAQLLLTLLCLFCIQENPSAAEGIMAQAGHTDLPYNPVSLCKNIPSLDKAVASGMAGPVLA